MRRGPNLQRIEQGPACLRHIQDCLVEGCLVGLGWRVEAADLAHELESGVMQLLFGGFLVGAS